MLSKVRLIDDFPIVIPDFSSRSSYLQYCRGIVQQYRETSIASPANPSFSAHLATVEGGGDMVVKTPWGGVDIVKRHDPHIEKFLVVRAGCFLAYEKHDEKIETLFGKEGYGVLVFRPVGESELAVEVVKPGFTKTLQPGQEHCLIALTDILVLEHSEDYKGMDQDLIFIYTPD